MSRPSVSTERVRFVGHVPEDALPGLYAAAELLAFPSLYEGFGLPALEAMACGTPVCASSTTGLGEAVGDAGLTFDPTSPEELAECIVRLLVDRPLRERLRDRGPRPRRAVHVAAERRRDGGGVPRGDGMTSADRPVREPHSLPWPRYGSAEQRPLIATSPPLAPGIDVSEAQTASLGDVARRSRASPVPCLLLALVLVAVYGSDVARHVPVYGPLDEIYHIGYVQKIADSGQTADRRARSDHPRPRTEAAGPDDVVIRGLDHPYDVKTGTHVTPVFPDGTRVPAERGDPAAALLRADDADCARWCHGATACS